MTDTRQCNIEESIATERERDAAVAALRSIVAVYDEMGAGYEDLVAMARAGLPEGGLRAGEYTATHTGPLTAEQLAEGVEPGLAEPTGQAPG